MPRQHGSNMSGNSSLGNYGGGKKQTNMYNRNRSFGGKNNSFGSGNNSFGSSNSSFGGGNSSFGGGSSNYGGQRVSGLSHPVSPWLSQSSSPAMGGFGRNIVSDQQAQLALASTLLNNLLKPASQLSKAPAAPPSLLSLNRAAPNSSSSFGGLSTAYGGGRDFGRQNAGKVQKDFRKGDFKNKRFGDRKNKKPNQPNRQANAGKKAAEKKDVKEEVKVETMDVDQSTSVQNEPVTTETAPEVSENSTEVKKDTETKKSKKEEPKASYSGIPSALLFCHICRKHMWDDSSFEKHLEGKPHKMMVQELDISYGLKVDLLRHEMRVAEQQRENDIQRAQRKGKNNHKSQQRDFCAMCNLSFLGMLPAHRKNERHQRLKKFLHPKCNVCSKEFYTRLEWDDHKLTPAHLKKLAEIRKNTRPDQEDTEFDIIDFIEDIDDEFDRDNIELKVVGKREPLDDVSAAEKGEATNGNENEKEETNEDKAEEEEFKKLPKYTPGVPVGENFMIEKTGSLCRVCNKFCLTSEDAKTHCQSVTHFNNVLKILKAQNKIVRKRRLHDPRHEDDANENVEGDVCKKPKMEDESTTSADTNGVMKEEPQDEKTSGKDVYDPEDPGSENEKDVETEKSPAKTVESDKTNELDATKMIADADSNSESKESASDAKIEVATEAVTPVSQSSITTRRGRGGQTPARGPPRARRGRRS